MSAHTPGPWYFDEDDRAVGPVSNKSIGVCSIMLADGNAARYHFGEQSIANANLIAAAPDLLEALDNLLWHAEQLEELIESERGKGRSAEQLYAAGEMHNYMIEAKKAIARAKGEYK